MNIRILLLSCAFLGTFVQTSFAAAAAPYVSAKSATLETIEEYNLERDREFVHNLYKDYWHLLEGEDKPSYREDIVDNYLDSENPRAFKTILFFDDATDRHRRPLGFIIFNCQIGSGWATGSIHKLAVAKEFQKKGVGSALLQEAIARMQKEVLDKDPRKNIKQLQILISVLGNNETAAKVYRKRGFETCYQDKKSILLEKNIRLPGR